MIEITKRQKFILDKIIKGYIQQAVPISSQVLERKYDIGISSASIRLELHRLTDLGYLEQPHISAGRVPTEKGYRLFVNEILNLNRKELVFPGEEICEKFSLLEKEAADLFRFSSEITKLLADFSSNLALSFLEKEMVFFKEGWAKVLKEPEFEYLDCTQKFMKMLQKLEENIEQFLDGKRGEEINVFIGKESKIPWAENFSLILSQAKFPKRRKGLLAILGPKRMDYSRNISLINAFVNSLKSC